MDNNSKWPQQPITSSQNFLMPHEIDPNQPSTSGLPQIGLELPVQNADNLLFPWLSLGSAVPMSTGIALPTIPASIALEQQLTSPDLLWAGSASVLQNLPPLLQGISGLDVRQHVPMDIITENPTMLPFLDNVLQQTQFLEYITQLNALQAAQASQDLPTARGSPDEEIIDVTNMEDDDCVVVYDRQAECSRPALQSAIEEYSKANVLKKFVSNLDSVVTSNKWKSTVRALLSAAENFLSPEDDFDDPSISPELVAAILEIKIVLVSSYTTDSMDSTTFSPPELLVIALTKLKNLTQDSMDNSTEADRHLHQVSAALCAVLLLLQEALAMEPGIQGSSTIDMESDQSKSTLNSIGLNMCSNALKDLLRVLGEWIQQETSDEQRVLDSTIKNFLFMNVLTALTYYQEALVMGNRFLNPGRDQSKGFAYFVAGRIIMGFLSGMNHFFEAVTTSNYDEISGNGIPTEEEFTAICQAGGSSMLDALLSETDLELQESCFNNPDKKHFLLQLLGKMKQEISSTWQKTESLAKKMENIRIAEETWTWRDELRSITDARNEYGDIQPYERGLTCREPGVKASFIHAETVVTTRVSVVTSGVRRTETVADVGEMLKHRVSDGWVRAREIAAECAGFNKEEAELEALSQLRSDGEWTQLQFYGTNIGSKDYKRYNEELETRKSRNSMLLEEHDYAAKRSNIEVEFLSPGRYQEEELRRKSSTLTRNLTLTHGITRGPCIFDPIIIARRQKLSGRRRISNQDEIDLGPVLYIGQTFKRPLNELKINPVLHYSEQARLSSLKAYKSALVPRGAIPKPPQKLHTLKSSKPVDLEDSENPDDIDRPAKSLKGFDSKRWYKSLQQGSAEQLKRKSQKDKMRRKYLPKELEHDKKAGVYKKLVCKKNCFCHLTERMQLVPREESHPALRIHEVIARYSQLRNGDADPIAFVNKPAREIPAFFENSDCLKVLHWEYRIREFGLRLVDFHNNEGKTELRFRLLLHSFINKDEHSVYSHTCAIEEFVVDACLKLDQVINILLFASLNWNKYHEYGHYKGAIRAAVRAAQHFIGKCDRTIWTSLPEKENVVIEYAEKPKTNPFNYNWTNWDSQQEVRYAEYEQKYYEDMRKYLLLHGLDPANPSHQKKPEFWESIQQYNSTHKAPTQNFNMLELEPAYPVPQFPTGRVEVVNADDSGIDSDAASKVTGQSQRIALKALRKKYRKTRKRGHIESSPPSIVTIDDDLESNPQKRSKYNAGSKNEPRRRRGLTLATMREFTRLMQPKMPQNVHDEIMKCLIVHARIILTGYTTLLPRTAFLTESAVNTMRECIQEELSKNAFFLYRRAMKAKFSGINLSEWKLFQSFEEQQEFRHLLHPKFPQDYNSSDYDRMWFNDAIGNIAGNIFIKTLNKNLEDWDPLALALFHEKDSTVINAYLSDILRELFDIQKVFSGTNGYEIKSFKARDKYQYKGIFLNVCPNPHAFTEPYINARVRFADEALSRFLNFPFTHTKLTNWNLVGVTSSGKNDVSMDTLTITQSFKTDVMEQNREESEDLPDIMIIEEESTPVCNDIILVKEVKKSSTSVTEPTDYAAKTSMINEVQQNYDWMECFDWDKYYLSYPPNTDSFVADEDRIEIPKDSDKYVRAVFESPDQTFYPIEVKTPKVFKVVNVRRIQPDYDLPVLVTYIRQEVAEWNLANRMRVAICKQKLKEQRLERESKLNTQKEVDKFSTIRQTAVEELQLQSKGDIWDYGDGEPLRIDTGSSTAGSPMAEDLMSPPAFDKTANVKGRFDDKHWNWMEQKRWRLERDEEDLLAETMAMSVYSTTPFLFKKETAAQRRQRLEQEMLRQSEEEKKQEERRILAELSRYKVFAGMKSMSVSEPIVEEPMDQSEPAEDSSASATQKDVFLQIEELPVAQEPTPPPGPIIMEMDDFALTYAGKPPDGVDVRIRFLGSIYTFEELERKILRPMATRENELEAGKKKKKAQKESADKSKKTETPKEAVPVPVQTKILSPVQTVQSRPVPTPQTVNKQVIRGKFTPFVRRGSVRTNLRSDLQKPIPIIEAHTLRKPGAPRGGPRIMGPVKKSGPHDSPKKLSTTPVKSISTNNPATPVIAARPVPAPTVENKSDDALFKRPHLPPPKSRGRSSSVPVRQPTRQELPVLRLRTPRTNLANPGPLRIKSFESLPTSPAAPTQIHVSKPENLPILRLRTQPAPIMQPSRLQVHHRTSETGAKAAPAAKSSLTITPVKPAPQAIKPAPTAQQSRTTPKVPVLRLKIPPSPAPVRNILKVKPVSRTPNDNRPVLPIPICKPSTSNARCGPRSLRFWNEYISEDEIRDWLNSEEIHPPMEWEMRKNSVERFARSKKVSKSAEEISKTRTDTLDREKAEVLSAVMNIESEDHLNQKVEEQAAIWASIEARKVEEQQELLVLMHMEWETETASAVPKTIPLVTAQKKEVESQKAPNVPQKVASSKTTIATPPPTIATPPLAPIAISPIQIVPSNISDKHKLEEEKKQEKLVISEQTVEVPNVEVDKTLQKLSITQKLPDSTAQSARPTASIEPNKRKRGRQEVDPLITQAVYDTPVTPVEPVEFFYIGPDGVEYPFENITAIQYNSDDDNDYIPQIALLNSERSRTPTTPTFATHSARERGIQQSPTRTPQPTRFTTLESRTTKSSVAPAETSATIQITAPKPVLVQMNEMVDAVPVEEKPPTAEIPIIDKEKSEDKKVSACDDTVPKVVTVEVTKPIQLEPTDGEETAEQDQFDRLSEGSIDEDLLEFAAHSVLTMADSDNSRGGTNSPEEKSPSPTNPWYNRLIKFLEDTGSGADSPPEGSQNPEINDNEFQKELLEAVEELSMKEPERCAEAPIPKSVQILRESEAVRKSGSSSPIARRLRRRSSATQAASTQRRRARRSARDKVAPPEDFDNGPLPEQELRKAASALQNFSFTPPNPFVQPAIQPPRACFSTPPTFTMTTSRSTLGSSRTQSVNPIHQSYILPSYEVVTQRAHSMFSMSQQASYMPRYVLEPTASSYNFNDEDLLRPIGLFDTHKDTLMDFDAEELLGPDGYFDERAAAENQNLFELEEELSQISTGIEPVAPQPEVPEAAGKRSPSIVNLEVDFSNRQQNVVESTSKVVGKPAKVQSAIAIDSNERTATESPNTEPGLDVYQTLATTEKIPVARKLRKSRLAFALTKENDVEEEQKILSSQPSPEAEVPEKPKRGRPKKHIDTEETKTMGLRKARSRSGPKTTDDCERIKEVEKPIPQRRRTRSQRLEIQPTTETLDAEIQMEFEETRDERHLSEPEPVESLAAYPAAEASMDLETDHVAKEASVKAQVVETVTHVEIPQSSREIETNLAILETKLVEQEISAEQEQSSTVHIISEFGSSVTVPNEEDNDIVEVEVINRRSISPIDFSVFHKTGMFGMPKKRKSKRRAVLTKLESEEPTQDVQQGSDAASTYSENQELDSLLEKSSVASTFDPFDGASDSVSINSFGERVIVLNEDVQIIHHEREDDLEVTFEDGDLTAERINLRQRLDNIDKEFKKEAEEELNPSPPEPKEEQNFLANEVDPLMFTIDYHFDEPDSYLFPPECIQVDPRLLSTLLDRVHGEDPRKVYEWIFANHKPEKRLSIYADAVVDRVIDNIPEDIIHVFDASHYQIEELVMKVIHQFSVHACCAVQYKKGQLKFRSTVDIGNFIRFVMKTRVGFFKAMAEHCKLTKEEQTVQKGHWDHACLAVLHYGLDTLASLGASSVACQEKATQNAIRLRFDAILYGLYAFAQQGGLVRTFIAMAEESGSSIDPRLSAVCKLFIKNTESALYSIKERLQVPSERRVIASLKDIIDEEELEYLRDRTRPIERRNEKDVPTCSKAKCLPFVFTNPKAAELHAKVLHSRMEEHECTECQRDFRHKVSVLMHMLLTHYRKFFVEEDKQRE